MTTVKPTHPAKDFNDWIRHIQRLIQENERSVYVLPNTQAFIQEKKLKKSFANSEN